MEFEIVFSCYTLDLPKRMDRPARYGFSRRGSGGTFLVLSSGASPIGSRMVRRRCGDGIAPRLTGWHSVFRPLAMPRLTRLRRIYWLIEDCKRYGTPPFAGLVRAGFIATAQMLQSFVGVGVLTTDETAASTASADTVALRIRGGFRAIIEGRLPCALRPFTAGHL